MSDQGNSQRPPPPLSCHVQTNDLGSLCPPPLRAQHHNHHASSEPHQRNYSAYYSQINTQYHRQQVYREYHPNHHFAMQQQNNCGTSSYANNYEPTAPPSPPLPSPQRNNPAMTSRKFKPTDQSETQAAKPKKKKVNPKMAQKYSGQGLKTITISGPGIRTQKFKICVGNHPDDIKKWIEERRKNFPRSRCLQKSNSNDDIHEDAIKNEDNNDVKNHQTKIAEDTVPLSNLLAGYGSSSSISEEELTSIVEPENEAAEETNTKRPLSTVSQTKLNPTRICKYYQRGKCHHGDSCKYLHTDDIDLETENDQRKRKRQAQSDRDKKRREYERELHMLGLADPSHGSRYHNSGGKTITNTSLLHKLLQRDKERERRLTLQLLRYIADCNYFHGPQKLMKGKD